MVAAHLRGRLQDWEPPMPAAAGSIDGSPAATPGLATGAAAAWPYAPVDAARYLILGAGYSTDDEHKTAVGELNGVDIHAVIAAYPFLQDNHALGFLADIVVGLAFGLVVSACWQRYFQSVRDAALVAAAVRHDAPHQPAWRRPGRQPELAYLWLVLLVLLWAGLVLLSAWLAAWLYRHTLVWVSPAAMLTGLLLESAVLGSVHQARHLLEPAHGPVPLPAAKNVASVPAVDAAAAAAAPPEPAPAAPAAKLWRGLVWGLHYLPTLVWCGVVAWTLTELLTHLLHGLA